MVSGTRAFLLLPTFISFVAASVCPQGKQFLNYELQKCVNCSTCDSEKGMIVLTPCEVHQDTRCAPLSKLNLDWNYRDQRTENPHRHKHHKHQQRRKESKNERKGEINEENGNGISGNHVKGVSGADGDSFIDNDSEGSSGTVIKVTNSDLASYSSIEALVWDWQAIALTLAVFSCILFFLVIALYSLYQARQWRRLKENFEAGTVWTKSPQERYVWI